MNKDPDIDGLTFAFYKAKGDWKNGLVRWATRSTYSHCEAILSLAQHGEEVLCHSASSRDGGVRSKTIILLEENWDLLHLPARFFDPLRAESLLARSQGASYDYPGILFSHVFSLNRHADNRWFCSEFCAELIGVPNPHTYSPQAFYDLVHYIEGRSLDQLPNSCQHGATFLQG